MRSLSLYGPQAGQNQNVYEGQRVAPLTDLQTGVLQSAPSFLSSFGTPQSTTQPLSAETGKTITDLLSGNMGASLITPEETEQYFQNSIYDPTMYSLKTDVLPSLKENYAGGNFFGSGQSKAAEKATADTRRNLTQARSDLNWNVLQQNQNIAEQKAANALAAVPQAMQYGNQPAQNTLNNIQIAASQVAGMNELLGIGQVQQTQEQQELNAAIAKFAEEHQITDPTNLSILLSLIGQTMSTSTNYNYGGGFSI